MIYLISPFENHIEARGTRNLALYSLLKKYDECKIITSNFSHKKKEHIPLCNFKNSDINYKIIMVPKYKKNLSIPRFFTHYIFATKLFLYLIFKLKRNDKLIISSIPPEVYFSAIVLSKLKKCYLHLDVRDIWPNAFPGKGLTKKIFNQYCKFFYKKNRIVFNSISYVSPSFENDWVNKYTISERKALIPLGYDDERWNKYLTSSKEKTQDKNKIIKLIYIGYLQSQFPLDDIILSVSKQKNMELHIVGDGEKANKYKSLAKNNIIFHGTKNLTDAASLVSSCDIGILPILGSAQMPNKFFDYIGAGLPILCIGQSDSSSIVKKYNLGWICSFNNEEIKNTIAGITEDIKEKKENVCAIRNYYSKSYNYHLFLKLMEFNK